MRPLRRMIKPGRRTALSERSGLTVGRTVAALRRSREALVDLESQLGDLLSCLRSGDARIDSSAPDRLARAKAEANQAMAKLQTIGQLFG
jgi:hypothetical protein